MELHLVPDFHYTEDDPEGPPLTVEELLESSRPVIYWGYMRKRLPRERWSLRTEEGGEWVTRLPVVLEFRERLHRGMEDDLGRRSMPDNKETFLVRVGSRPYLVQFYDGMVWVAPGDADYSEPAA
jgi:hypothetical protein